MKKYIAYIIRAKPEKTSGDTLYGHYYPPIANLNRITRVVSERELHLNVNHT